MKRASAALLAASLSSILLSAQSANSQTRPPISFGVAGMEGVGASSGGLAKIGQGPVNACPVSMSVQHRSDGNLVRTQTAHPKGVGQRLHITLASSDSKQIMKATLTVYGVSPKGRLQYATQGQYPSSVTLDLTVPFMPSVDGGSSADFWAPGMTAVQLIDLKSIAYRDGSTWKLADGQSCQVKPDLLMQVTSR